LLLLLTGLFALVLIGQALLSSSRWIDQPFPGFFVHANLTVGPYSAPGWSGAASGIKSLDRVVRVNGVAVRDRADLYDQVRSAPVGSRFHYEILRGGQRLERSAPSVSLTLRDWLLSFGVYIVIGAAFLAIGVAPYCFRASSPAALPLCFMVLAVFVWFQTTFDFMTEGALPKELRIFALSLTPSAAIHLAWLLSEGGREGALQPLQAALIYGVGIALGALNSLTYFGPLEAWLVAFRAAYVYVCIGAAGFLLIVARALGRVDSDLDRSRLRVMFVGALLGFLIPAATTVLTSSFDLAIPYNVALIPTVVFPVSVAYALLKYSLFDLGNTLRVGVTRIALMALLTALYAALAFWVAPWAGQSARDPLVPVFFSILVVAIFNPLLRQLESVVDRYVYRQDYDPAAVQEEVSLFLRSLNAAPVVAEGFAERMGRSLGMTGALVVYKARQATEPLIAAGGSLKENGEAVAAALEQLAALWQAGAYQAIARNAISDDSALRAGRGALLAFLERWRIEVLLPLACGGEVRGVALFGAKRSGREYGAEDLRLLQTLTDQLALSLENGLLYEESEAARRRAEASNKKLIEMDRVKKDFVANLCHELRTPVSTIIGYGEILRDLNVGEEARRILDRLVSNGQDLSALMDDLMNFSRLEADGSAAQFEIVKLNEILSALQMMTQRLIRERPIEFGIRRESPIETIETDGSKLQQILVQLLTNALKFTEKGRIELSVRSVNGGGDLIEIGVADTGIGIRPEDQELIFEDFRQLDGSSKRSYGGTGLGLGLCKKLATALGGEIRVTSEVGVGSVFRLLLPVRPCAPAAGIVPA